jgi:hypothetical protein
MMTYPPYAQLAYFCGCTSMILNQSAFDPVQMWIDGFAAHLAMTVESSQEWPFNIETEGAAKAAGTDLIHARILSGVYSKKSARIAVGSSS